MIFHDAAAYAAARAKLIDIGFTNTPDVSNVDWTVPEPVKLYATVQQNNKTVQLATASLQP